MSRGGAARELVRGMDDSFERHRGGAKTVDGVVGAGELAEVGAGGAGRGAREEDKGGGASRRWWRDPLSAYAEVCYAKPRLMFYVVWALLMAMTVSALLQFKMNESGTYDWLVGTDETVSGAYMLDAAETKAGKHLVIPTRSVKSDDQVLHFVYEAIDGNSNALTPAKIKAMLEIERTLLEHEEFGMVCILQSGSETNCDITATVNSLLTIFYDITATLDTTTNITTTTITAKSGANGAYVDSQANIDSMISLEIQSDASTALLFDSDFTTAQPKAHHVQSFYMLGVPLDGYKNPEIHREVQLFLGDRVFSEMNEKLFTRFGMKETFIRSAYQTKAIESTADGALKVMWWSLGLQRDEWSSLSSKDFSWTILCIVSVYIYTSVHTRSMLIASVAMLETIFAVPVGYFFFRVVFRVEFFQWINILVMFVILGIGADDVFVFVDAYAQSGDELHEAGEPATLLPRLKHTMRRSMHAIFVTSFTTAAAFLATAFTPLLPLISFGIFAAIVLVTLFLINLLVLPPFIVIYERSFARRSWRECWRAMFWLSIEPYHDPGLELKVTTVETTRGRRIERFFRGPYTSIMKTKMKYVILVTFSAIFSVGVYYWTRLDLPTEPEEWFPTNHMYTAYKDLSAKNVFNGIGDTSSIKVSLVWGLGGLDRSGANKWDPSDLGKLYYADDFDPSTAAAQAWIMDTYEELKTASCLVSACGNNLLVGTGFDLLNILAETDSSGQIVEGFYYWLNTNGTTQYHPKTNPIVGSAFNQQLCEYHKVATTRYPSHVGFFTNDCSDNRIAPKYILMQATSSVSLPQSPKDFAEVQSAWTTYASLHSVGAPDSLGSVKATSGNIFWLFSITASTLLQNVYRGFQITFPMVFAVLLLSTRNWLIAIICTCTIGGILTSVLGLGVGAMMGWSLGSAESIASVIVVGFACDYVVHLANAYTASPSDKRDIRMQDGISQLGVSVLAGAVTTCFSGCFLALCILTFFIKFSFLVCWTIICSFFWAVLFFPAAMFAFGPENHRNELAFWRLWK
jgi:protein dispatched 1